MRTQTQNNYFSGKILFWVIIETTTQFAIWGGMATNWHTYIQNLSLFDQGIRIEDLMSAKLCHEIKQHSIFFTSVISQNYLYQEIDLYNRPVTQITLTNAMFAHYNEWPWPYGGAVRWRRLVTNMSLSDTSLRKQQLSLLIALRYVFVFDCMYDVLVFADTLHSSSSS